MATVYSYIRFSSVKQMSGDSLRRQLENGEAWIKQNKHTPASLNLRDLGVSAFRGKNKHKGALSKFLEAVEEGRVERGSILLVEHLDRLSRQGVDEAYELFRKILKAGVKIAVLRPYERVYSETDLHSPMTLFEPLMLFWLSWEESEKKSKRVGDYWEHMRTKTGPFSRRRPSWLDWDEDAHVFKIKPDAAKAIRYIAKRALEGVGQKQILRECSEKFPALGRSGKWNGSYITKIMLDRALIGELQPHKFTDDGERVPTGQAIPNYYPAVLDEGTFYRMREALEARYKKRGRKGHHIANLFSGLIWNANDRQKCHVYPTRTKRLDGTVYLQRRLVSYGHVRHIPGSDPLSFDYLAFERHILAYLREISSRDIFPKAKTDDVTERLGASEGELAAIKAKLTKLEDKIAELGPLDSLINAATKLEKQKKETQKRVAELKAKKANQTDDLSETKSLLQILDQTTDPNELYALRQKLQHHISQLIESVWIMPLQQPKRRVDCYCEIYFRDGAIRRMYLRREDCETLRKMPAEFSRPSTFLKNDPSSAVAARLMKSLAATLHARNVPFCVAKFIEGMKRKPKLGYRYATAGA